MESDYYRSLVNERIISGNPENIYADYNAINHSKIDFICYAINNNLINRDAFICWSDFGYFNSILHNNPSEYPINHIDITKFKLIFLFYLDLIPIHYKFHNLNQFLNN
jgi:hypothetical protein